MSNKMNLQQLTDIQLMSMLKARTHNLQGVQQDLKDLQTEADRRVNAHMAQPENVKELAALSVGSAWEKS
jgi:hypothetical protein